MNPKRKSKGALVTVAVIAVVVAIAFVGWKVFLQNKSADGDTSQSSITNFKECAAAGNPILESYPEQCRANGKTFTKKVDQSTK